MSTFDDAFAYLLENEGIAFSDDSSDAGGPTKYGVTLLSYSEFVQRTVLPEEIKQLTIETVKPFYFEKYWLRMSCDKIIAPQIAISIFDASVLYGTYQAGRLIQMALSDLNKQNVNSFLDSFNFKLKHLINLIVYRNPEYEKFRNGWEKRADRLLTLKTLS